MPISYYHTKIKILTSMIYDEDEASKHEFLRFDALKLLEMLRDKRMMFVGDSIQRGMFESMVCLVQSAVTGKRTLERIPPRKVFTIEVC